MQYIAYNSPGGQFRTTQNQPLWVAPGLRINRVLAIAGQTITWEEDQMLVDGLPVDNPLPAAMARHWSHFTVPAGHFVINPANLIPVDAPVAWRDLALVPEEQVQGRLFFRSWPLSRAGFLD